MASVMVRTCVSAALIAFCTLSSAQQAPLSAEDNAIREQIRQMYKQTGRTASDAELDAALASFKQKQAAMMGSIMALQMQAKSGNMPAMIAPAPSAVQAPVAQSAGTTENDLRIQMETWPPFSGLSSLKKMRDGIEINGQQLLDPEGRISQYAFDDATGNLGYVVDLPDGGKAVKVTRAGVNSPIKVATFYRNGAMWAGQLVSGTPVNGNHFSVQPTGFVISRDASIFSYQAGKGVSSYSVPSGYFVAPLQKGNVGTTGYILLEKANATGGTNSFDRIASSFQAIGKGLGMAKKEDYALMRLSDSRLVPLDVDANSNTQTKGLNCRQRTAFVNECSKMISFESLWTDVGTRSRHYYWRIDWLQTKAGPVAVVNEGQVLKVITLDDGKEIPVFSRAMGINEFDLTRSNDGARGIRVKMGFSYENVPDIVAAINNPPQLETAAVAEKTDVDASPKD